MKPTNRRECKVRAICYVNGVFVDRTVHAVIGAGKPYQIIKEIIHDHYRDVYRLTEKELADKDENDIPQHDRCWCDPSDWSMHYLRKIR